MADLGGSPQRAPLAHDAFAQPLEVLLGGGQQLVAFARTFRCKERVFADDQALAREIRTVDFGEVTLVEQRWLQRSPFSCKLLDGWRPQRGDPIEPSRLEVLLDASLRDHSTVADQDHAREPKTLLELGNLRTKRSRITGIAFEYLDGNRTSLG